MSTMETEPVLTPTQLCDYQINTSKSKFQYSFPKDVRFHTSNANSLDQFYNLPSVKMERQTNFGYGGRSDFTKGHKNGADNFYNVKRDFDEDKKQGIYYSIGESRDKYEKVYNPLNKMNTDKNFPGPGKYNWTKPFGSDSTQYSLRPKLGSSFIVNNKNPGPGTYKDTLQINPTGKYATSKITNINVGCFSNDHEKRFNYKYNKNPGPKYKLPPIIGRPIFNSTFTSSRSTSFGARFQPAKKDNFPGPGSYFVFSEFNTWKLKELTKEEKKKLKKKRAKERKKRLEKKRKEEEKKRKEEEEKKKKEIEEAAKNKEGETFIEKEEKDDKMDNQLGGEEEKKEGEEGENKEGEEGEKREEKEQEEKKEGEGEEKKEGEGEEKKEGDEYKEVEEIIKSPEEGEKRDENNENNEYNQQEEVINPTEEGEKRDENNENNEYNQQEEVIKPTDEEEKRDENNNENNEYNQQEEIIKPTEEGEKKEDENNLEYKEEEEVIKPVEEEKKEGEEQNENPQTNEGEGNEEKKEEENNEEKKEETPQEENKEEQ